MGLLALIASFSYSLFFILQAVFGLNEGSVGLRIYSVFIFTLCIVIYVFSLFMRKISYKEIFMILLLGLILIGFFITKSIYGYSNQEFDSTLLSFGVRSVPALLIGVYIAKADKINEMCKWLQPFMLFFSIGIVKVAMASWNGDNVVIGLGDTNYQLLSYQAAYAIGMNLFLIFNRNNYIPFKIFNNKFFRTLNIILIPIQLICILIGGGRGAFVVLFIFLAYALRKNITLIKNNKRVIIMNLIIFIIIILAIPSIIKLPFLDQGVNRLAEFFLNFNNIIQDDRTQLYSNAINIFLQSPVLGYGIGSIFYEMKFYSHNIFTDILVEGGIILFSAFLYCLIRFFLLIKREIEMNKLNEIILICFICSFVMLLFSGNYLRDSGIWFSMGYVFTNAKRKVNFK